MTYKILKYFMHWLEVLGQREVIVDSIRIIPAAQKGMFSLSDGSDKKNSSKIELALLNALVQARVAFQATA